MTKPQDPLKNLRVATPCPASWNSMIGDERVRHCALCSLNVYNLAEMTSEDVRALLVRTEGRVCGRLYRRADGTVLTSDCPTGLRAVRLRMSRMAAAIVAALFSLSAFASDGKSCEKPRMRKYGSKVKLEVERVVTPRPAGLTGVVRDKEGYPLPGVTVVLRDEAGGREFSTVTDVNGAFGITALSDGIYRVDVKLEAFEPAVIEHLPLKQSEVTRVRVTMRLDSSVGIMGILTSDPMTIPNEHLSTTYSQELIDRLPI